MNNQDKIVSVVILNWNGLHMLRRFLPSVLRYSPEARVIVADNGSTDDSLLWLKSVEGVEVMAFPQNYGFAEGYNLALSQVSTPYALLLNDDVQVTEGWLSPLLNFMELHPNVAACQPKLRSEQRPSHFEYAGAAGGFMDRWGYPYCRGRMMDAVEEDYGQYDSPVPVFWTTGAAMLVRTAVYLQCGGLDAQFFAHMEEIDLCWRLRSRGHELWCLPQSVVYHVGGATLPKGNPRKTFLNFRNNLLMLYKNVPNPQLWQVMAVRFFLDYAAALQMLLSGRWGEAWAVVKARRAFWQMRPGYAAVRCENLHQTILRQIPEQRGSSLLWAYYVRRIRCFSQWK